MMDPAWTHGWSGLLTGYAAVELPMIAGLIRGRAGPGDYLFAPLTGAALTLVAAGGNALLSSSGAMLGLAAGSGAQAAVGIAVSAAIGYLGGRALALRTANDPVHRRGTLIDSGAQALPPRRERVRSPARGLTLAGVPVGLADEGKHFKMIGTTGTGKSTAIAELLGGALERGDRAVIADPDGGYLSRHYRAARGDVILNPFDSRSVRWDLFGEVATPYDVDQLARALIPDHDGPDRSWRGYARTFLSAVTRQVGETGSRDIGELYRLLVVADTDELRTLVRGTPAQPFLEEHNARMFDSIRSVTASAIGSLEYVAQQQAPPLAIRQWVRDTRAGVLFIPYQAGQIAALRSTISAWMRLAIFETMDAGEPPPDREASRTWFVVDELDAIGQIDGLKDALARIRKFGGRCVLGFQSIAQVSSTYGHGDAHTIVENCGNTLILRCSASEGGGTARFASQLVGEREVLRTTESRSRRYGEFTGSTTRSEHFSVESALMASEIEQLPDLAGYLKLASAPDWRRVALTPPHRPALIARSPDVPAIGHAARERRSGDSRDME